MHFTMSTHVAAPPAQVWEGFTKELFLALAPPFPPFHLRRFDGCRRGDEVHIELGAGPFRQPWTSTITDHGVQPDGTYYFVDEGQQLPTPLRFWRHRHLMQPAPGGGTYIVEDLEYRTGLGLLDGLMRPMMWAQFAWRRPIYRRWFGKPGAH
jgi:ligand-binding SRPBCC domain-containing protein